MRVSLFTLGGVNDVDLNNGSAIIQIFIGINVFI